MLKCSAFHWPCRCLQKGGGRFTFVLQHGHLSFPPRTRWRRHVAVDLNAVPHAIAPGAPVRVAYAGVGHGAPVGRRSHKCDCSSSGRRSLRGQLPGREQVWVFRHAGGHGGARDRDVDARPRRPVGRRRQCLAGHESNPVVRPRAQLRPGSRLVELVPRRARRRELLVRLCRQRRWRRELHKRAGACM